MMGFVSVQHGWLRMLRTQCHRAHRRHRRISHGHLTPTSGRYPLIDFIYSGPQVMNVPRSAVRLDGMVAGLSASAIAELGFIWAVIDGRDTIGRSRAFREHSRGAVQLSSDSLRAQAVLLSPDKGGYPPSSPRYRRKGSAARSHSPIGR